MREETFNKYKRLLDEYSSVSRIDVSYKDLKGKSDAEWRAGTKKQILLSVNVVKFENEIANYLHELGHMRDDFSFHPEKMNRSIDKAYERHNKGLSLTKNQKKIILETEYRAWMQGRGIAKQMGIRLGKWYDNEVEWAIYSYYKLLFPSDPTGMFNKHWKKGVLNLSTFPD